MPSHSERVRRNYDPQAPAAKPRPEPSSPRAKRPSEAGRDRDRADDRNRTGDRELGRRDGDE
jgi:hypothetical protein